MVASDRTDMKAEETSAWEGTLGPWKGTGRKESHSNEQRGRAGGEGHTGMHRVRGNE